MVELGKEQLSQRAVALSDSALLRHIYIIGKTGVGKSTLLENITLQMIGEGKGVCFIDPHGQSALKILDSIPKHRSRDVIYFDIGDRENPIGFNIFDIDNKRNVGLATGEIVRMFRHLFGHSWGVRLEQILYNSTSALLEHGGMSLLGIKLMLNDKTFRERILRRVHNEEVKAYWRDEYGKYSERFRVEASASVLNKVGQFVSSPLLRNIVGQSTNAIDLREVMDKRKILIVNLAKGKCGAESAKLLGSMLVTKILVTAMERAVQAEENGEAWDANTFPLVVDEFHNFGTETFAELVAEGRKYGLALVASHQYTGQIESEIVRNAMINIVGTLIAYQVGGDDAEILSKPLELSARSLVDIAPYEFRIKTQAAGKAVNVKAEMWKPEAWGRKEILTRQSRMAYARPVQDVEASINAFYEKVINARNGKARNGKRKV